jgi:WD40 repeat protein
VRLERQGRSQATSLEYSSDGKFRATADSNGNVRLWDFAKEEGMSATLADSRPHIRDVPLYARRSVAGH